MNYFEKALGSVQVLCQYIWGERFSKTRSIWTPVLTISMMNWPPGAYICPLMRYWHFETIFGLALQQNPNAGRKFTHTLIWPNLTLFWKKKWNLRCGVAVAAKMAKNGRKMAQNGQKIKCIILTLIIFRKTPRVILTPFLLILVQIWGPGG